MIHKSKTSSKANMTSDKEEIYQWNTIVESNPFLDCFKRKCLSVLPFVHQNEASLRSIKVINKVFAYSNIGFEYMYLWLLVSFIWWYNFHQIGKAFVNMQLELIIFDNIHLSRRTIWHEQEINFNFCGLLTLHLTF